MLGFLIASNVICTNLLDMYEGDITFTAGSNFVLQSTSEGYHKGYFESHPDISLIRRVNLFTCN